MGFWDEMRRAYEEEAHKDDDSWSGSSYSDDDDSYYGGGGSSADSLASRINGMSFPDVVMWETGYECRASIWAEASVDYNGKLNWCVKSNVDCCEYESRFADSIPYLFKQKIKRAMESAEREIRNILD